MKLWKALTRRKRETQDEASDSELARVLGTFDLVALGVGSTLGVGIYVLAGEVAKEVAGPAVIISFLLAAVVTAFAGLSYAEFGARVPKAGSAYIYSYFTVGELVAFIIGWSLILEYSIGAASVAKGISSYIDALSGYVIRDTLVDIAPLNHPFLASYVDIFAMALCLQLTAMLATGVRESSTVNNIFTSCNVLVVVYFIIAGSIKADVHNWNISPSEIPPDVKGGAGGFAPFGVAGIIHGAAICFYGFVGFDCIATTGEEVRNPQRAIPRSIVISLGLILVAYLGVSSVVTLLLPYYLQDSDAPIPHAFQVLGWTTSKWIVSIGALFGLFASLFGALFPLPRILYAMASDGLLFKWLGKIHPRLQTPLIGTLVSGVFVSVLAAFFNLQQLVGLNAIGTLLTYALVSVCVLILRFQHSGEEQPEIELNEETRLLTTAMSPTPRQLWRHFITFRSLPAPTVVSSTLVVFHSVVFCILSLLLSITIVYFGDDIYYGSLVAVTVVTMLLAAMLIVVISIARQPSSSKELSFKMPLVPYLPCISIFFNIYLMIVLDGHTWIRFCACMALGLIIYFFYGIKNSSENVRQKKPAKRLSFSAQLSAECEKQVVFTS